MCVVGPWLLSLLWEDGGVYGLGEWRLAADSPPGKPQACCCSPSTVVMGLDLHPWNVCSRIVGGGLLPFQAPDPSSWLVGGGGEGRTSSCPCS